MLTFNKISKIFFTASILMCTSLYASSNSNYYEPINPPQFKDNLVQEDKIYPNLRLTAYVFMNNRNSYKNDDARSQVIQSICADSNIISIDFTELELTDDDLNDIFQGLYLREKNDNEKPCGLQFMNFYSDNLTERGIISFLKKCQKGQMSKTLKRRIVPDLRNTFIRVSFILTDEFIEELQQIAPSVFAGGFRIVH